MKVLNLEPYGYSDRARKIWRAKGWEYIESEWKEAMKHSWPNIDAIIVRLGRSVGAAELDRFPNLRLLVSATTGLDHLNIDLIKERGIKLVCLRGHDEFLRTIPSTAEHTWALLLSLIRMVPQALEDVREGHWRRDRFRGYQLRGKTLGIVGMGRTGRKVAEYASAFGMRVRFFDPFVSDAAASTKDESLDDLLPECDIVSLHVHLLPETTRLINDDNITKVKAGAFLINTSRGRVWDELAVSAALRAGTIAGVATDVLSDELSGITTSPLLHAMRDGYQVIITPHIGGATWDAMWACEEFLVESQI